MNRLNKEAHAVEELGGIRCSIVEKNVSRERADFLKYILEGNGYTVIVAPAPPPKAPPLKPAAPAPAQGQTPAAPLLSAEAPSGAKADVPQLEASPKPEAPLPPPAPEVFYVGVTDISFHAMLSVYERSLRRPDGKPVSIAYWNQEEEKEKWYWKNRY